METKRKGNQQRSYVEKWDCSDARKQTSSKHKNIFKCYPRIAFLCGSNCIPFQKTGWDIQSFFAWIAYSKQNFVDVLFHVSTLRYQKLLQILRYHYFTNASLWLKKHLDISCSTNTTTTTDSFWMIPSKANRLRVVNNASKIYPHE